MLRKLESNVKYNYICSNFGDKIMIWGLVLFILVDSH